MSSSPRTSLPELENSIDPVQTFIESTLGYTTGKGQPTPEPTALVQPPSVISLDLDRIGRMAEARMTRRLAAILAADVVGYSRMMAGDEAGTLAALKRHRKVVFDPIVAQYSGRIVKLIGDGTLVEFASVVDAVNCALAIQRILANEATAGPKITLRIGVNLGDVIIDGDDIYGDGVNVAARLEPLAEPGGICVASIVNESVGNRIDVTFENSGEITRTSTARYRFGDGTPKR